MPTRQPLPPLPALVQLSLVRCQVEGTPALRWPDPPERPAFSLKFP